MEEIKRTKENKGMGGVKIMGIVGIVLSGLCFLCEMYFDGVGMNESAEGWGIIATMYLIAFSIVGTIKG